MYPHDDLLSNTLARVIADISENSIQSRLEIGKVRTLVSKLLMAF